MKMKESGIEWIGEIPEDWKISKVKYICSNITDGSHFSPATQSEGKPYVTVSNVNNDYIDYENAQKISENSFLQLLKNGCNPNTGDVLLAKDGTVGRTAIVKENDFVVLSSLAILTPNNNVTSSFLKYSLDSDFLQKQMEISMAGSALRRITIGKINKYLTILPPLTIQKRIADFLDEKCRKINSLKNDIEKQIETLEQYKKSVITEAVTKGINSNVKMKDSGSIWFGKIPENWNVKKIKYIFKIKKDIAGKDGYTVLSITQKGIKPKDLTKNEGQIAESYINYQLVNIGDFAMNHMDLLTGWVDVSQYKGVTSPDYRVFVFLKPDKFSAQYYLYIMQMCYANRIFYSLGQGVSGMGRWRLPADEFLNFLVPIPSLEEQKEIANYLDSKCASIDAILKTKQQQLETLEEYKKSLIFEYVTGKKEV